MYSHSAIKMCKVKKVYYCDMLKKYIHISQCFNPGKLRFSISFISFFKWLYESETNKKTHLCFVWLLFSDMKQAFDLFDKNNDGRISSEELGRVLRTLGHDYSNDQVQEMISNVDTNGKLRYVLSIHGNAA